MLKKAGLVAALVLTLSSGMMAAEETALERTWKQMIPTAHLQYNQGHGNVETWGKMGKNVSEDLATTYSRFGDAGVSMGYGLMDNLEVRGFVAGVKMQDAINNIEGTGVAYLGNAKGRVYNANDLMVAISGTVAYDETNGTTFGIDGQSNKIVNDKVTLHNNAGIAYNQAGVVGVLTNGVQYKLNDRNAIKAAVNTVFRPAAHQINPSFVVAMNSQFSAKTNNLLAANVSKNAVELYNVIESKITPNFLLRGQADMTVDHVGPTTVSGNVGVDAEKKLGIVTLSAGFAHNLKAEDWRLATVKAGVKVDVTEDLNFSINAANVKQYYPELEGTNTPSVTVNLNYEI